MEASLAATGMFDVLATRAVRFMIDSVTPPISTVNWNRNNTLFYPDSYPGTLYNFEPMASVATSLQTEQSTLGRPHTIPVRLRVNLKQSRAFCCKKTIQLFYLWEISQYFRHLVSSLATSHVDDDVRVGKLGQGLGDNCFAATEGSWNGCGTSLYTPKENESR